MNLENLNVNVLNTQEIYEIEGGSLTRWIRWVGGVLEDCYTYGCYAVGDGTGWVQGPKL